MTQLAQQAEPSHEATGEAPPPPPPPEPEPRPFFIFYLEGPQFVEELRLLSIWVETFLLPVYGGEVTAQSPWCPRWREHSEAIGYLHALWLAWQFKTGPKAEIMGPFDWHRDCLGPAMEYLRKPSGPFAGCKPGAHRAKERPVVEDDGFLSY